MNYNVMKLFRSLMKLGKVETEQGVLIFEGDVLTEGMEVYIEDENGNIVPAPDGQYSEYTVKDGKVAPKEEEAPKDEPKADEEPAKEEVKVDEAEEEVVKDETKTDTEEVVKEEPKDEPKEDDKYEERIKALEDKVAELAGLVESLTAKQADMEFSAMKPAEIEIKDIATKSKGAMKYFSK